MSHQTAAPPRSEASDEGRADLALLLGALDDPALVIDVDGLIAACNEPALAGWGFEPAQLFGRPWTHLLEDQEILHHPPEGEGNNRFWRVAVESGSGRRIPCRLKIIHLPGQPARWVALFSAAKTETADSFLDKVVRASPELMMVLDREATILDVNPALTRLAGWSAEDRAPRSLAQLIHADDRRLFHDAVAQLESGGSMPQIDSRIARADGSVVWVQWSLTPMEGRCACIGRDITRRRLTEQWQKTRERQLIQAQAIAEIGDWRWYPATREEIWSPEMFRIFGFDPAFGPPSEETFLERVVAADRKAVARLRADLVAGKGRATLEFRALGAGGKIHHIRAEGDLLRDADGKPLVIFGICQDITQSKETEAAIRRDRDEAASANEAKSRFLANMSHEIRTPMNAILGFAEMMEGEILGPIGNSRYKEYCKAIHESGALLLQLINRVLDLAKIEAGKYRLELEEVDLEEVAQRCLRMCRRAAETGQITLRADFPEGFPTIQADNGALSQVMINLIGNAIKFTEAGGLVTIGGQAYADHIEIKVADTGIGIPAEQLATITKPFEQGHNAYAKSKQGAGLGLSICEQIARLHGGEVRIESEEGCGTTVTIRLPRSQPA